MCPTRFASSWTAALSSCNRDDVHALQLRIEHNRVRLSSSFVFDDLHLPRERLVAERFQLAANHLLIGDENLTLVQGNVERALIGDLGPDKTHLLGQFLSAPAEGNDIPPLQYERRLGSQLLVAANHVHDPVFGMRLAEARDSLVRRSRILEPIGPQTSGTKTGQARTLHVGHTKVSFVFLRRGARVDPPPSRQILADQDDADRTPNVGDAIGQRDHGGGVLRSSARRQTDLVGSLLGGADGCRHSLRASKDAASAAGRQVEQLHAKHHERQTNDARDDGEEAELGAIAFQTVHEGWPHAQTNPIHEQVIEYELGEIIELELGTVNRSPR